MGEKAKVRLSAIFVGLLIFSGGPAGTYVATGDLSGPDFIGSVIGSGTVAVSITVLVLLFPQFFTRDQLRERQLERRQNRAGQIIAAVLFVMALLGIAALFLVSYVSG